MRYSKKGWEKRKEDRKGFAEFFQKHIKRIKDTKACCEECGARLKGHVSEVAHILPKSTFKSIATDDENVIYMCGMYSENQCHTNFDTFSVKKFRKMLVFNKVSLIFDNLKNKVKEKINYKIYERYEKEEY